MIRVILFLICYKLRIVLNTNENEGPQQAFTPNFMHPLPIQLDENSFSSAFGALSPFHTSFSCLEC